MQPTIYLNPLHRQSKNAKEIDCQAVLFFANASDCPYSNERSGASVKTARENGEKRGRACEAPALHTQRSRLRRFAPSENVRKRPKTTVLQSMNLRKLVIGSSREGVVLILLLCLFLLRLVIIFCKFYNTRTIFPCVPMYRGKAMTFVTSFYRFCRDSETTNNSLGIDAILFPVKITS